MPTFTDTTPRHPHKVAGELIQAPYPFTGGHILTGPEAKWLNSAVVSTVANALSGDIRRTGEAPADFQAAFDAKYESYALGVSNRAHGGGAAPDPVAAKALSIAGEAVKALLKSRGLDVRKFTAKGTAKSGDGSRFHELRAEYLDKNPWVHDQARAQIEALQEAVDEGEELDLSVEEDEAA